MQRLRAEVSASCVLFGDSGRRLMRSSATLQDKRAVTESKDCLVSKLSIRAWIFFSRSSPPEHARVRTTRRPE
eukprot:2198325-Pleurochrysis_carterae.AAC.1